MKNIAKNLYQHENGTFYSLHRIHGRQIKRSLGTKDKKAAKQLLKQSRAVGSSPLRTDSIDSARPPFCTALDKHERNSAFASRETELNFARRKRTLLNYCKKWSDFDPVSIWKDYRDLGYVSAPNQLRWFLRSFVEYAIDQNWLTQADWKSVCKIPHLTVPPRRVQIPPPNLVSDLLAMCEAEHKEAGQFLRFLAYTGLRITSGKKIRWEEINFKEGEYKRQMKGGQEAVIPLLPEAFSFLQARWLAADKPDNGLIFEMGDFRIKQARRILKKYARGLGVGLTYPHALRHNLASVSFSMGLSAGEVASMLGHTDGGTLALQTYGHVIPSQLKSKVNALRIAA